MTIHKCKIGYSELLLQISFLQPNILHKIQVLIFIVQSHHTYITILHALQLAIPDVSHTPYGGYHFNIQHKVYKC